MTGIRASWQSSIFTGNLGSVLWSGIPLRTVYADQLFCTARVLGQPESPNRAVTSLLGNEGTQFEAVARWINVSARNSALNGAENQRRRSRAQHRLGDPAPLLHIPGRTNAASELRGRTKAIPLKPTINVSARSVLFAVGNISEPCRGCHKSSCRTNGAYGSWFGPRTTRNRSRTHTAARSRFPRR
jgi:hypothetical protein